MVRHPNSPGTEQGKSIPQISILWLLLPIGLLLLTFFWKPGNSEQANKSIDSTQTNSASIDSDNDYTYISHKKEDFRPLVYDIRESIRNTVKDELKSGMATEISVNFELLDKGINFTYGYTDWYWPASLLKIVTLIAYLKESETDTALLSKKIIYHRSNLGYAQNLVKDSLKEGGIYTYNDLLRRLIVNSDNQACYILEKNIGSAKIDKIYSDFTIDVARGNKNLDFIPINQYMQFLRSLYNATYLNKKNSEYALSLLINSEFVYGIRAGIPPGIKVASKFGEKADKNDLQLHDCGIVYYDNHPYMIGVMTKGTNFEKMAQSIQRLSNNIFQVVKNFEKGNSHSS